MTSSAQSARSWRIRAARGSIVGVAVAALVEVELSIGFALGSNGISLGLDEMSSAASAAVAAVVGLLTLVVIPVGGGFLLLRGLERRGGLLASGLRSPALAGIAFAAVLLGWCAAVLPAIQWHVLGVVAALLIVASLVVETVSAARGDAAASSWSWALGLCWILSGCAAAGFGIATLGDLGSTEALLYLLSPAFICVSCWAAGALMPIPACAEALPAGDGDHEVEAPAAGRRGDPVRR